MSYQIHIHAGAIPFIYNIFRIYPICMILQEYKIMLSCKNYINEAIEERTRFKYLKSCRPLNST